LLFLLLLLLPPLLLLLFRSRPLPGPFPHPPPTVPFLCRCSGCCCWRRCCWERSNYYQHYSLLFSPFSPTPAAARMLCHSCVVFVEFWPLLRFFARRF